MIVSMVRNQFPLSGVAYHLSAPVQGAVLFALSGAQAAAGFLLGWSRRWMYRACPVLGFGLLGSVGLGLFTAGGRMPHLWWPAALCLGVYCGSFYFYFVYHSLVHPTRGGRYVSINEAIVGIAGVAGPAAGGLIADHSALWVPYALSAGVVLAAVSVQAAIHAVLGRGSGNALTTSAA